MLAERDVALKERVQVCLSQVYHPFASHFSWWTSMLIIPPLEILNV